MKRGVIVLAVVLGLASLAANGVALYRWGGQQTALSQAEQRLDDAVADGEATAALLAEAEASVRAAQESVDARTTERDGARSERDDAREKLSELGASAEALESRIDDLENERDDAVAELAAEQTATASVAEPSPAPAAPTADIGLYDGATLERMITEAEAIELYDAGLVSCEELSCWYSY